jgi:TatD DNase family protein
MTLVDSHCHLDDRQFDGDREAVIDRALAAGIKWMLAVGSGDGPPDLEAGIRLAETHDAIFATVGVHPHDARKATLETFRKLADLLLRPRVVAMGEIGLDYHYDNSPREQQRGVFIRQMHLAQEARKPIVIHTREAWDDTFRLLHAHWKPSGLSGIMHCFSGGPEEAKQAIEMGFLLSFGGIVTYPKALRVQQAAKSAPLDCLLVETDAPYLAPVPKRGKRNEPAFVVETARKLADLRGESFEKLSAATTANFVKLCLPQAESTK